MPVMTKKMFDSPIKMRQARFKLGEVVRHRVFAFRGVIFDIDPVFNNTEEWWQSIPEDVRPRKDQPFYHLLAENDDLPYRMVGTNSGFYLRPAVNGPHYAAYAASKAGLMGLTRSLAASWGRQGIRVNAICPGWIETELMQKTMDITFANTKPDKPLAVADVFTNVFSSKIKP